VFARTSHELAEAVTALHHDDIAISSEKFITYCDKLLQKSELWASCHRKDVALRGHNTNNDRVFARLKAFKLVQLIDFFVTRLESYYEEDRRTSPTTVWMTCNSHVTYNQTIQLHCAMSGYWLLMLRLFPAPRRQMSPTL